MADPVLTYQNAVLVSLASGGLGGIMGGLFSLIVARTNRQTTLQALEKSNQSALTIAKENNTNAVSIAEANNQTTLEALRISAQNDRMSESIKRRREEIIALGTDFVARADQACNFANLLWRTFPSNVRPGHDVQITMKSLDALPEVDVLAPSFRGIAARAEMLGLEAASQITAFNDFFVRAVADDQFEHNPIEPIIGHLRAVLHEVLGSLREAIA